MVADANLQLLLDSFVAIASERDAEAVLEQAVDLARLSTKAKYGAAVALDDTGISTFVHRGMTTAQVAALPHLPEGLGMLGAVLEDKVPIRLEVLQTGTRSVGFPLGHVPMQAFLGVPIVFDETLLGAIYLTKPPGQPSFSDDDEVFMGALARQTGAALEAVSLILEREAAKATLEEANAELRLADQLKNDFVSMASHELRTPLTSILGFSSTLRDYWDSTPDEDKIEYIDVIDRQARRLSRLVNDLLAMSRIEAGKLDVRHERVDMGEVARAAVIGLGSPAAGVEVVGPDHLDVTADPDHVEQIVFNFVGNALKYGAPPITIELIDAGDTVELRVCDGGAGIPVEFAGHLFEKFARASTGSVGGASGTGLGLSIVQGLARANGGEAWYEPNQPTGSVFAVRFPAWREEP